MKQKVKWDMYVWVITILVTVVLCVGLICTRDILGKFIVWATITVLVFVAMWTVAPISISVDDTSITVRKRIGNKRILISNIETVRAYYALDYSNNTHRAPNVW